jgi:hypothetical protein
LSGNEKLPSNLRRGILREQHSKHLGIVRRFKADDRHCCYSILPQTMINDTLESKLTAWYRKKWYAQVFVTNFSLGQGILDGKEMRKSLWLSFDFPEGRRS